MVVLVVAQVLSMLDVDDVVLIHRILVLLEHITHTQELMLLTIDGLVVIIHIKDLLNAIIKEQSLVEHQKVAVHHQKQLQEQSNVGSVVGLCFIVSLGIDTRIQVILRLIIAGLAVIDHIEQVLVVMVEEKLPVLYQKLLHLQVLLMSVKQTQIAQIVQ